MATLEDKILGEKLHNYCSSSESEDEDSNSDSDKRKNDAKSEEPQMELPEPNKWEGSSTNTGPKGVIKDWQRFKQLESERRKEDDKERLELMKKLTLTVQSALDEEAEAALQHDDPELSDLMQDDEFLSSYRKQRMQELMQKTGHNIKFGKLIYLSDSGAYLDAIDKEDKAVKVIIHLYEQSVEACRTMNVCLGQLAAVYESVKICAIQASKAGLSNGFKVNGVPALLIYRAGQMLGNFVRLSDELGSDFCIEDLQGYLIEHGMLEDKTCTPLIIKKTEEDSDSD